MTAFLRRPANSLQQDGQRYSQFLAALERATKLERGAVRQRLDGSTGTVADALSELIEKYPDARALGLDGVMERVREEGDRPIENEIEPLRRRLEPLQAKLVDWHAYVA
jgi:DNA-binding transcriptional regulator YbjK